MMHKTYQVQEEEIKDLRSKLEEAQGTLNAIRSGEVDAVVVAGPDGEKIFTLKGAEYPYRIFVESMSEGAATVTAEGHIVFGNNSLATLLGAPLEKLLGASFKTYISPSDALVFSAALENGIQKKGVTEITLLKGKKKRIPVLLSYRPIIFEGIKAVNMIVTDLSEQKRHEEIMASERLARLILEQAGGAIIVCDENGRIIRANQLAHQFCDGNPLFHLMDEMFFLQVAQTELFFSVSDVLKGQLCLGVEVISKRKKDRLSYLLLNATPLKDNHNQTIGCVIILSDITERKKTEQALLASEAKHRRLFESNIVGVKYATEEKVTEANEAFLNMIGYTYEDLQKGLITWQKIVPPNLQQVIQYEHYHQELIRTGQLSPVEREYVRKDGNHIHALVGMALLQAHPFKWVSFVVDITQRKQMEDELHQIREELEKRVAQRTKALEHTVEALKKEIEDRKRLEQQLLQAQKMESIGILAGGVAHSFNNMLTVILGFGEVLQEKITASDTSSKEYVDQIINAAKQASALTHNLLVFSRKQVIEAKPVDINAMINDASKLIEKTITDNIEYHLIPSSDPLFAMMDVGQMTQVLLNLATNARDAMPQGGKLTIAIQKTEINAGTEKNYGLESPGSYASISVADTGIGIPPERLEKIFEPFYTTKEVGKGTGLGLTLAYGIVKQHSGTITVGSQVNQGTQFSIYLPLTTSGIIAERPNRLAAPLKGVGTILVVEDEDMIRNFIQVILQKAGYQVIMAFDGESALIEFKKHLNIDLLITDVVMPKKNGRQILGEIRKKNPKIKAIFISGYTANILKEKGERETESFIFLPKPFSSAHLLKKVMEAVNEK